MKKMVLLFLLLPIISIAQSQDVRYELYIKCCMGNVSPNRASIMYGIYKDGEYIGTTDEEYVILPDTGIYKFINEDKSNPDTFVRHFDKYAVYRDTFNLFSMVAQGSVWSPTKKKYEEPKWFCDYCLMNGYIKKHRGSGTMEWEGLYKNGVRLWYKTYDDVGNLIYYTKRNFWGKEKVILDKRREYWDKERSNSKSSEPTQ